MKLYPARSLFAARKRKEKLAAGGATYVEIARAETVWFFDGQLGVGLEGRVSRRMAFTVDLRGLGQVRPARSDDPYGVGPQGQPAAQLGNQLGVLVNVSLALYR